MGRLLFAAIGAGLCLLGALWFLQGAHVVHLESLLCVSVCRYVPAASRLWMVIGAVVALIGAATLNSAITSR